MLSFNEFLNENYINEAIRIDTSPYLSVTGNKPKPSVYGRWVFSMNTKYGDGGHDEDFEGSGTYKEVAAAAKKYFKSLDSNITVIYALG